MLMTILVDSFEKVIEIPEKFNNYHNRLRFTLEKERNRSVSFFYLRLNVM